MKKFRLLAGIFMALSWVPAYAASGAALPQAPVQYGNLESMQRGAATFVNYCLGCHSAQYMRYGRMVEDLGVTEEQVETLLIHNAESGLGDGMVSAMRAEDSKEWFYQALPPDLTLVARLRGADWLYAYLRGFYRDPARPNGWNNTVFNNVAMPHVMAGLQGVYTLDADTHKLLPASSGSLSAKEYDSLVSDLVTFLVYMGEPSRAARLKTGYLVMALLLLLLPATYFLYREYWREIK